jgi:hypothetical protein
VRCMLFMYPGITDEEWMPSAEAVEKMMAYNEELTRAGVLLALDGLQPPSKGARVRFAGGAPSVTDGPFPEAREVVGGYWIIQVSSLAEATEWARRCPANENDMIEVRPVFELSDFAEDVQAVAKLSQTPPEQTADA